MMFWGSIAIMALVASVIMLGPLWRRGGAQVGHREGAMAIFVDQLAEVEAERARGLISPEEAAAAATEIKRRMLALKRQGGVAPVRGGGGVMLMVMAAMVPVAAAGIYALTGAPGVESQPYAGRAEERAEDGRIADLAEKLKARLLNDAEGGPSEGWELLGQTYMRMGRYGDAAEAFEQLVGREGANSAHLTQYAEALIAAEGGAVTRPAAEAIDRALDLDRMNPAASYYKAQWLEQEGRVAEGRKLLVLRLEQQDRDAPWIDSFIQQINRMGQATGDAPVAARDFVDRRGPSAADVEAAGEMSVEERSEFIRSMVAQLAERLADEPEDLDGWLQLGRAYTVLGESADALAAYQAAEGLLQGLAADDPRRAVVRDGLAASGG